MNKQYPLIDLDFALKQLAGNEALLFNLLGKFKEQYKSSHDEVAEQVNTGDFHSAKMRVHTAKGITGSLGLKALFESCKILEVQLKNETVSPEVLSEFVSVMRDSLVEIDAVLAKSSKLSELTASKKTAPEPHNTPQHEAKQKLIDLLSRHEFIDDTVLHRLVQQSGISESHVKTFVNLVESLEYDKAILLLRE